MPAFGNVIEDDEERVVRFRQMCGRAEHEALTAVLTDDAGQKIVEWLSGVDGIGDTLLPFAHDLGAICGVRVGFCPPVYEPWDVGELIAEGLNESGVDIGDAFVCIVESERNR